MLLKKRRRKSKYEIEGLTIDPNIELEVGDIEDYRHVFKTGTDPGYKGLKEIARNRDFVRLITTGSNDESIAIEGTITHYDDLYNQLVVVSNGTLKRLVFDQIVDVKRINEGEGNEEFYNQ